MSERYQENSPRTQRVQDTSTVLGFLTNRFNAPVFPAMSTHYQPEGIGMGDFEEPVYHPSPIIVEDTRIGFDESGNYHCPSLRTEHLNRREDVA